MLGPKELRFLKKHSIPIDKVLDAYEMARNEWMSILKNGDYLLATGVTPCRTLSHDLRTSGGHCVICKPETLRFSDRYYKSALIYVAHSRDLGLCKIGISNNINERNRTLNSQRYAGAADWIIHWSHHVEKSGETETAIHSLLNSKRKPTEHLRDGEIKTAIEVFEIEIADCIELATKAALQKFG
jgi:hypothetical protein